MTRTTTRTPEEQRVHARRWGILAILCGSLLLVAMDTTVLNVAFPSLVSDLQPNSVEQLWIIDAYALALSGLLVTAGALGDRLGRKRLLVAGFVIFAVASVAAVLATAAWHVIAARALLGVGGAAIMPSTLSILRHVFTDPKERAFAYAVWTAVIGGGMALGPVVGGLLVEHHGWHSAFLLNVPVAVVAVGVGLWLLPESRAPHTGRWDWLGVGLSFVGMVALVGGIKQLGKSGVGSPLGWLLLALGAAVLVLFVRRQLRLARGGTGVRPLLAVRLFADRAFAVAVVSILLAMIALGAVMYLMTQWFQYANGYSPFEAGVRLLPMPIALIVSSVVTPRLMHSYQVRQVMAWGLVLTSLGLAAPWLLQQGWSLTYPGVAVALAAMGLGVGVATTTASVTLMAVTPQEHVGGAAAIDETSYELGAALGVAALGSLAAALYRSEAGPAAGDSIGEAAHAADVLGGEAGQQLLVGATHAFTQAMTPAILAGALLTLVAAAVAWRWVPRDVRPTDATH
ncbi:MFS transporter [Streptomyces sp. DSM 44915]|uniref:MFS transporter n=1 Tax=Streptomyces chisholmiae TaxID=3075540 RepID=A0ABU2JYX7_9ACTN|nr:MFS transporter [Streptomyces sp. DSM 44915]MDT0270206.1 MFS transporter [Streptomyces sp. DSM 44915]